MVCIIDINLGKSNNQFLYLTCDILISEINDGEFGVGEYVIYLFKVIASAQIQVVFICVGKAFTVFKNDKKTNVKGTFRSSSSF